MKHKLIFLSSLFLLFLRALSGQPKYYVEHYDLVDGLPQSSVMSILQDKKGFMWFSTWDGLCRFDGSNFIPYKNTSSDTIVMRNSRINKIIEDKYGYIWVQTYGNEAFCFDPVAEEYIASFKVNDVPFQVHEILPQSSGRVWITSTTMGALYVSQNPCQFKVFNTSGSILTSNNVRTVYEDSTGGVWLLTESGLIYNSDIENNISESKPFFTNVTDSISFFCAYETDEEISFGAHKGHIYSFNKKESRFKVIKTEYTSNIISIQKIIDNRFLVLTDRDGFFIINKEKEVINAYNTNTTNDLLTDKCISAYIDGEKNCWIETDRHEVIRFDFLNNRIHHYNTEPLNLTRMFNLARFYVIEDSSGDIWIQPRGGGFSFYDRKTDTLKPFYADASLPGKKFSNILHACYLDRQGNIWLGARSHGLDKVVFEQNVFHINNLVVDSNQQNDLEYGVRAVFEDNQRRIWQGCNDGLIRIFNEKKEYLGHLCNDGTVSLTGSPLRAFAYCFHQNKNEDILIGTKGNGLFHLKQILASGKHTFSITNYMHDPDNKFSLSGNNIYSIHEDTHNRIWIGCYGGGINLWDINDTDKFINAENLLQQYPMSEGSQVRTINSDSLGNIYVGTTFGLIVFKNNFESIEEITWKTYPNLHKGVNIIQSNDITNIYTSELGETYICTYGGGLNRIQTRDNLGYPVSFENFGVKNGLPSDVVLSVIEDFENNLWIATEGSLSKYDVHLKTFEVFGEAIRLLDKNYIVEAPPVRLHTGEIYFGYAEGTISFNPSDVKINDYIPPLAIISLSVSGEKVNITNHINEIKKIHLKHYENNLNIEYAALDYRAPFNIQYAYKLEGIDENWIYNSQSRSVNYSNLSPGNYIFRVRSTNSDGNWVDNEEQIYIRISSSFWKTRWAYFTYFLLFVILLGGMLYSIILFYRMKDRIMIEQEQTELKTRFFTDISHEIRTPLTMIVSPVENILEDQQLSSSLRQQLSLVLKNANRMLQMVNQILDFRKIQKQKLKLQEVYIGQYITDICNNFFNVEDGRKVNISVQNLVPDDTIWADCYSLEKLVFNLISNAIKYTPQNKNIDIILFRKDKSIAFQVKDEGEGMKKETLNKLFTRFESFNTNKSKPSTGIGLSIVKEVAEKHHARISVESEIGKGSTFTVYFPIGTEAYQNDNNVEFIHSIKKINKEKDNPFEKDDSSITDETGRSKTTILVVEDDLDLREFISSMLVPEFNIIKASNGVEGYEAAVEKFPDFILSDIMMPEMDGMDFLDKIRNNPTTSHIPIILLTAKTNIQDKIKGFELGADDYITKPFNVKLLKTKINTIIRQRQRLSNFLTGNTDTISGVLPDETDLGDVKILPQDEKFLNDIQLEIERNLDNSDYHIDDLVATTIFSRKVFFLKLKSLTGLAPVEFIREIRLKHALTYLQNGYYPKETSYMVGFTDVKYFAKCFKKKYGMSPSQYRGTNKDTNYN